jgi:MFS family permease
LPRRPRASAPSTATTREPLEDDSPAAEPERGSPAPAAGLPGTAAPAAPPPPRGGLARTFTAFRHRNFRIFWTGAFLSNVGTWMQSVGQGWLVLELTDSPLLLGVTGFAGSLPMLLLLLVGGVYADRVDRRRLLIGLQLALMSFALVLGTITALGVVTIEHVLGLALLTGTAFAFSAPAYQAMISQIVPRQDLMNAIAMNSTQFNASRVVGPALTGFVVAVGGIALCFFANAASFLASILALAWLEVRPIARAEPAPLWRSFLAGLHYVRGRPRVKTLLVSVAGISVLAMPYATMLPVFARDVLGLGPAGLGYLTAAAGLGAVAGALSLAARSPMPRRGWNVIGGVVLTGVTVAGFALSRSFPLSAVFLFGVGFAATSTVALCNTIIQELVTDQMRGRVMSMFGLSFMGTLPIGSLAYGVAAKAIGAPGAFTVGGIALVGVAALVAWLSPRLRAFD